MTISHETKEETTVEYSTEIDGETVNTERLISFLDDLLNSTPSLPMRVDVEMESVAYSLINDGYIGQNAAGWYPKDQDALEDLRDTLQDEISDG